MTIEESSAYVGKKLFRELQAHLHFDFQGLRRDDEDEDSALFGAALPLRGKPRPWSAIPSPPPPPPSPSSVKHVFASSNLLYEVAHTYDKTPPSNYSWSSIPPPPPLLLLEPSLILEPIKFDFRANSNLEPTTILEPISNLDKSSILEPISNLEPSTILEPNSILEPIYNKFSLSRALGWKLLSVLLTKKGTLRKSIRLSLDDDASVRNWVSSSW